MKKMIQLVDQGGQPLVHDRKAVRWFQSLPNLLKPKILGTASALVVLVGMITNGEKIVASVSGWLRGPQKPSMSEAHPDGEASARLRMDHLMSEASVPDRSRDGEDEPRRIGAIVALADLAKRNAFLAPAVKAFFNARLAKCTSDHDVGKVPTERQTLLDAFGNLGGGTGAHDPTASLVCDGRVNLQRANLKGDLRHAVFERPNMNEATLAGDFSEAVFRGTKLEGASVEKGAIFKDAVFEFDPAVKSCQWPEPFPEGASSRPIARR